MSDWTQGDIESDGIKVHFYRTGQGDKPALVLAHGFTDNGLCWSRLAQVLEHKYDIVMVDARNHGRSGHGPATLKLLAQDHAAVITSLQLGQAHVLGHSVGAGVAAGLARDYPELVASLILEDPPWSEEDARRTDNTARRKAFRKYIKSLAALSDDEIIQRGKVQHPFWHDDEFVCWAASKRQVTEDAMELLEMDDWTELVPHIECPTLLVYADGDRDGIVSHAVAAKVRAMNPMIQLQHIPEAGHNLRREQFEKFAESVSGFLGSS